MKKRDYASLVGQLLLLLVVMVLSCVAYWPAVFDNTLGYRAGFVTQMVALKHVLFFFEVLLLVSVLHHALRLELGEPARR